METRYNSVVDTLVHPLSWQVVRGLEGVRTARLDLDRDHYGDWLDRYVPDWKVLFKLAEHKKILEFYISFSLLDPGPEHVFMDAAGGVDSYLPRLACRRKILQDIKLVDSVRERLGDGVELLECNAGAMPLAPGSVDRISVHHSFEHFCGSADTDFITEVQRILAPGGRCCIVPLFLADIYAEITDDDSPRWHCDPSARYIVDPTAAIPGGEHCGHFARVYDIEAFRGRVLDAIDPERFAVSVREVTLGGAPVPDMGLECHAHVTGVNSPYRAMVLERLT